jgi:hypothetical protein
MVATTFNNSMTQNPTFRVWRGMSNRPSNMYWEGDSFFIALWKFFEAKNRFKGLVRLEWV